MKTWVTLLSLFEDLYTVILEKEQMALVDMLPNPDEEDDVSDKDEDEWEHLSQFSDDSSSDDSDWEL